MNDVRLSLSKAQKNELLSRSDTKPSKLLLSFTDILCQQLKHFVLQNYKITQSIKGFFSEDNDYTSRELEVNQNPACFMDTFGPCMLPILWKLENFILFELVCDESSSPDNLRIITSGRSDSVVCERAIVRTCLNHFNSNGCGTEGNCSFIFHELLCNVKNLQETLEEIILDWKNKYRMVKHIDEDTKMVTSYWLGQTVDEKKFPNRSNFLSVMTHSEVIYKKCDPKKTYLYEEQDGVIKFYPCDYPINMTPSDFKNMKDNWNAIDSESSKLNRSSSKASVIECNLVTQYRTFHAVQSVMRLTQESSHAYLTNGRRGSLLLSLILPAVTVVGFERSKDVYNESVKLVEKLNERNHIKSFRKDGSRSRIHLVNANYATIRCFEGFQGACMYVGNDKINLLKEYEDLIPKLFATQSLMFFWCAKLNRNIFNRLVPETGAENKKWYVKILKGCKQEQNQHSFYVWFKRCRYWPENLKTEKIGGLRVQPDREVMNWIQNARSSIFATTPSANVNGLLNSPNANNTKFQLDHGGGTPLECFKSPFERPKRDRKPTITPKILGDDVQVKTGSTKKKIARVIKATVTTKKQEKVNEKAGSKIIRGKKKNLLKSFRQTETFEDSETHLDHESNFQTSSELEDNISLNQSTPSDKSIRRTRDPASSHSKENIFFFFKILINGEVPKGQEEGDEGGGKQ